MNIVKIFILLLLFIIIISFVKIYNSYEHMLNILPINENITWKRDPSCKYKLSQVYSDILNEYFIKETNSDDWILYFPCTYDNNKSEIDKINSKFPYQRIFIVTNTDEIASKSNLWKNLVKTYGRTNAKIMSPNSYILYDNNDLDLFTKEYDSNKIYIMKKNIQRQEGLKITNNKDEILNGFNNKYVIVQELLQDPYLINNRKINMRFYVLLVCQNNEIDTYVHKEGFMYYTKKEFVKNSLDFDVNITTGYIERSVYDSNPLTHNDFKKYLDNINRKLSDSEKELLENNKIISHVIFNRIYSLISNVIYSINDSVCKGSKNISFQLFGFDIAVSDTLYPKIMEVNVGPNLDSHDKRDSEIKHLVIRDIFKVLKIIPDNNNGYINIM